MPACANYRLFAAAAIINGLLGVLYAWSLFLAPLEALLGVSRATMSVVPSLALVCFTSGVLIHDTLIRRVALPILTSSVLACAGLGYLLFWAAPSYATLAFGYGVMFGLAGGIGFGLALALARETISPPKGWIVGVIAATFAGSGMSLSAIAAAMGTIEPVPRTFGFIGTLFVGASIVAGGLLRKQRFSFSDSRQGARIGDITRSPTFVLFFLGNFAICYAGLMFVSHGTTILRSHGLSVATSAWAPILFNFGYVLGALMGGIVAARFPSRITPMVFCLLSGLLAAVYLFESPVVLWAPGLMVIGAAFGGTVSIFVMLFSIWWGPEKAGALFGRLNISYGIAGLTAPSVTGWLYTNHGDYDIAVLVGMTLLLAGSAGFWFAKHPQKGDGGI